MQMQTFQPQNLVAAGDRIHVPSPGPVPPPPAPAPSLLSVFAREAWKRKKVMGIWAAITAVIAVAAVLKFAQPLYRAEGKLSYRPNFSRGSKPIYTPPNIQSTVQILRAPDVLDPVRERYVPGMSPVDFGKYVRIEVSKQSEFIDVGFDYPDPAIAAAVANDLMTEGLKYFADVRVRSTKDAIVQVTHDVQTAKDQLEAAKEDYRQAHLAQGVADPEIELGSLKLALADIESQIRHIRDLKSQNEIKIRLLEAQKKSPPPPTDGSLDDEFVRGMTIRMSQLTNETNSAQNISTAKIKLEQAEAEERRYRPLVEKGVVLRTEYDKVLTEIKIHRATLKKAEEMQKEVEQIQQMFKEFKEKSGVRVFSKSREEELHRLKLEVETVPGSLAALLAEKAEKSKSLNALLVLQKELGSKEEEIRLLRNRLQDFDNQLRDAANRSQDPNSNDLRIHGTALAGTTPYSTSAPKVGLAVVGTSALLFVGYLALFALPKLTNPPAAGGGLAGGLPKAMVALIPYTSGGRPGAGPAASAGALASATPPSPTRLPGSAEQPVAEALAARIVQGGFDPGGIVMFAPTNEELKVGPVIGDLGELFTRKGDKVLIFDARQAAETPTWAGPQAPAVAESVEGYLDGKTDASVGCFVPTALSGVEYSRADLSTRVGGVMAAHRFRQLVDEMRTRYSVVFLVAPPVKLEATDPFLAMMSEGMVLVTEPDADPVEVHAFLDTLCQQVPARLYGTLTVPKSAA